MHRDLHDLAISEVEEVFHDGNDLLDLHLDACYLFVVNTDIVCPLHQLSVRKFFFDKAG